MRMLKLKAKLQVMLKKVEMMMSLRQIHYSIMMEVMRRRKRRKRRGMVQI